MRNRCVVLALAIGALLVPAAASAQLFKCKGPDGKTVYSDTRCEASSSGSALKVMPNSATRSERERAEEAAARAADTPTAVNPRIEGIAPLPSSGTSVSAASSEPYELTSSDRERIRNLEVTAGSLGAYSEQKTAARMQITGIRRGGEARMTGAERERRDSLTTDLSSTDAKKRSQALGDLRSLYSR